MFKNAPSQIKSLFQSVSVRVLFAALIGCLIGIQSAGAASFSFIDSVTEFLGLQGPLAAADYTVTTTGNAVVVTDNAGNADTLAISEPSAGNIKFAAATRTFSVDGGAIITGDSGNIPRSGVSSITVNQGGGADTASVGAFMGTLPSLTINGDAGDDTVNFNGDIAFAANANLDVDLQNETGTPGIDSLTTAANANLITTGTGTITVKVSKNVAMSSGSSFETQNGALIVEANQQATPTTGNFVGVDVNGGLIKATGTGAVTVKGKGGDNAAGSQHGVLIQSGGNITGGTTNLLTVEGTSGASSAPSNHGVYVSGVSSTITSSGANVSVTGTGGNAGGSSNNHGVRVDTGGQITAGSSGTVTVVGYGGNLSGAGGNRGVTINGASSTITSGSGAVSVTGTGGGGAVGSNNNYGVVVENAGQMTAGVGGTVTVLGNGGNRTTTGGANYGVYVVDASSTITSSGSAVSVTGTGGGASSGASNVGVIVETAGQITAGVSGTVNVVGNGGTGTGGSNHGVDVTGANSTITSGGGNVSVTGTGGVGGSTTVAVIVLSSGAITTLTNGGTVTLIGDSMNLSIGTPTISAQSGSSVTLRQKTNATLINLGGADGGGTLGLSVAELNRVTAGTINIGDTNSGAITVSGLITGHAAATLNLISGANIDIPSGSVDSLGSDVNLQPGTYVFPSRSGVDVTTSAAATLGITSGKDLKIVINNTTVDSGYTQLNVAGLVNLSGVVLNLSGTHTPVVGQTFTIVNNDGSDAITGTFAGLPQGATIPNFLGSGLNATITYVGGTGSNDVVLTVTTSAPPAFCVPASLDPTFDGDGKTTTAVSPGQDAGLAVAIQTDAKIVVGGFSHNGSNYDFALTRYNANGSLDPSFDTDGKVTTPIGTGDDFVLAVAIQTDGKIVAGGYSINGTDSFFVVVRYNTDGSLDPLFDGDGKAITQLRPNFDIVYSIAIQSDGKIVAGGYSEIPEGVVLNKDFAVVRYNTDGSLDPAFDGNSGTGNGIVITPVGSSWDIARSVAIQSDGKIVATGESRTGTTVSGDDFAVVRYNTDGSLDPLFDGDGKVITPIGSGQDVAAEVTMQSDGRILVTGYGTNGSNNDFELVRYNTNGSLDPSFDGDGKVVTPIGTGDDSATSAAIQFDGKIIAAGYTASPDLDVAVVRYNADGSLDPSWDGDGKVVTPFGSGNDLANAVLIQPADGKIVAAGQSAPTTTSPVYDFAVVRYGADCLTAANVSVSGRVTTPDGRGLRGAIVSLTDSMGVRRTTTTGILGTYTFDDVMTGENYVIGVTSKRYRFESRVLQVFNAMGDVDFTGEE